MTDRISFPQPTADANGPAENELIIEIFSGGTLSRGGEATYADITPWKKTGEKRASQFVGIVVEVTSTDAQTVGDGTTAQAIGLFGEITGVGKFLLGFLGINQGTQVPQIPLPAANVGFAQIVADVALYDGLSVGVINSETLGVTGTLTVVARPIRDRFYGG